MLFIVGIKKTEKMASNRPELKFSDISEERGFYKRYVKLPEKPSGTVRIVDKGDYYTAVGDDAVFIAENVYHTMSVLKDCHVDPAVAKQFNEPTKYVTMSLQIVASLLKLCLLDVGNKVEIYDRSWKLIKSASPGNIEQVSDLLNLNIDASIVIASLKIQQNPKDAHVILGLTFIDTSNYKIGMMDIIDNEAYSNLESFLIQLGIRECLVPDLSQNGSTNPELKKITNVIDRCGSVVTIVPNSEFSNKDVEVDLAKLLGNDLTLTLPQNVSQLALGACNALLNYLQLLSEQEMLGKYELIQHSLESIMKLDSSAIKALNLFPQNNATFFTPMQSGTVGSNGGTKVASLFQLLNNCKTNSGVRLLNEWLKQPLTDFSGIQVRHNLVEFLIDQLELRQILQTEYLPGVPDIRRLVKKLNKNGTLEDVLKVYQFSLKVPDIINIIESFLEDDITTTDIKELVRKTWCDPLKEFMEPLKKFDEMVQTTVDLDAYQENNEFMIRVEFNEELAKVREQLTAMRDEINAIHLEAAEDLGFDPNKKLKLENHHIHGWCMRLTRNDAKALRNHKQYIELSTVKAGIFFSTRKMKEIAQETVVLQKDYERLQSSLVKEIVSITLTYTPIFEKLSLVIAHLDVLCSFAHASSYAPIPYVRPTMHPLSSDRRTKLMNSRHPVLEVQDDVTFIANDVDMAKDVSEFQIITGPNMGGKSTYIRQVGVITLMAQIGCFVPCDNAEISIVDAILCRVGAGDSQLKGVSTFMVEMLETASILKNATSNSLIIVDELGRGTSTYDGFGLAWAIAEHIAKEIRCFALFATHFHELTNLSEQLPNVKNMHVIAHIDESEKALNSNDITLLYKVEPGISDRSFGIHVAEVVQFPKKIVSMAKRKANELEELKNTSNDLKRAKLNPQEIAEGNLKLKCMLKEWKQSVENKGLLDVEKLSEEETQLAIESLLKKLCDADHSDDRYFSYLKELL